jgi:diguanylate cyclase (GGDEF)-like protein
MSAASAFFRALAKYHAFLFAGLGFGLVAYGFFRFPGFFTGSFFFLRVAFVATLLTLTVQKVWTFFRAEDDASFVDVEVALLALLAVNVLTQFAGDFQIELYSLNTLVLALTAAYAGPWVALFFVLFLAGVESGAAIVNDQWPIGLLPILVHLMVNLLFVMLIGGVLILERRAQQDASSAMAKLKRDEAHLDPAAELSGMDRISPEAREQSNVDHLFLQDKLLGGLSELARSSLDAHTVAFLHLDMDRKNLSIAAFASQTDMVDINGLVPADEGFFALALNGQETVSSSRYQGEDPSFYTRRQKIRSLIVTPMIRMDHVVGVVAADSREVEHFNTGHRRILEMVAEQVVENINEIRRIRATQMEREQFAAFYEVANRLSSSLKIEEVMKVVLTASASVVEYDAAVLTLVDQVNPNESSIRALYNLPDNPFLGAIFKHSDGLVGWVTQLNTYLSQPEFSKVQRPVFSPSLNLNKVQSLLCLPLPMKDRAIGTLTFFWGQKNAFNEYDRKILEVLAIQAAVSIENARIYEKMEMLAVTDGLTSLYNHRYFQQWLASEILRAQRMPLKISMILCDIDHFKNINDTYGHPVGDIVLKQLSAILRESVRSVDLAARYGGEEFALVLLDSDRKGSKKLADRLRKRIANTEIDTPSGVLKITVSMGIATFPDDALDAQGVIDRSDTALYHSKRTGRNRATLAMDVPDEPPEQPDEDA